MLGYLPLALWMLLIFLGSTEVGSSKRTSRFLVPFLKWLKPDISEVTLHNVQMTVRKTAHMVEYGILAFLAWGGRKFARQEWRVWNWKEFIAVVLVCAAYAASDEIHQSFVADRGASPWDVGLDTMGAFLAMSGLWLAGKWRGFWRGPAKSGTAN